MTNRRRILASMTALSVLAGCASQATTAALRNAQYATQADYQACGAGIAEACQRLPADQQQLAAVHQQYHSEVMQNGGGVLVGVLAVAAIAGTVAAVAGAPGPHP